MLARTSLLALVVTFAVSSCDLVPEPGMDWKSVQGRFRVQPVNAVVERTNAGAPWDEDNSPPDVRVIVTCPDGDVFATPVKESFAPLWKNGGCSATAEGLLQQGFRFRVEDVDGNIAQLITEEIMIFPRQVELTERVLFLGEWYGVEGVTFRFAPVEQQQQQQQQPTAALMSR